MAGLPQACSFAYRICLHVERVPCVAQKPQGSKHCESQIAKKIRACVRPPVDFI
jgi:hypothetical protein